MVLLSSSRLYNIFGNYDPASEVSRGEVSNGFISFYTDAMMRAFTASPDSFSPDTRMKILLLCPQIRIIKGIHPP